MDSLEQTVTGLREKIVKLQKTNEDNTKASLIDPLLKALGWDTTDIDEVERQYHPYQRSQDRVDYALRLPGKLNPCLLIEAKPLGLELDDDKPIKQIVNYSNSAGVDWCVLTNGDEYRIYRANAPVPLPKKLFKKIRISDEQHHSEILDALSLLSKDSLAQEKLDSFWETYFLHESLKPLVTNFIHSSPSQLVKIIKSKTSLPTKKIKGLLANVEINVITLPVESRPPTSRKRLSTPSRTSPERYDIRHRFWAQLLEKAKNKTKLHANISPSPYSWVGTGAGISGLTLSYVIQKHSGHVELYVDRGKGTEKENKLIFDKLAASKATIEKEFGEPLEWQRLEGKRACRIKKAIDLGGYRDDENKWPEIQDVMIDAMIRLDKSLKPHIAKLKD